MDYSCKRMTKSFSKSPPSSFSSQPTLHRRPFSLEQWRGFMENRSMGGCPSNAATPGSESAAGQAPVLRRTSITAKNLSRSGQVPNASCSCSVSDRGVRWESMWRRAEGTLHLCRELCRRPFFWRGGTADAFEGALAEADEAATEPEYRLQGVKQGLQSRLARRQASCPSQGLPPLERQPRWSEQRYCVWA